MSWRLGGSGEGGWWCFFGQDCCASLPFGLPLADCLPSVGLQDFGINRIGEVAGG
jgi:hypothetical protein